MDLRSSAQDVHRCDLCETAKVHSYCDFCHVNLCKQCIGEHISNGYEKHKIVPFQDRKSTLIYPKYGTHPSKNCDLQCNNCNIFICTSCVGSKVHKGHDIWELDDIYKEKKENIKMDAEELDNLISPTYEEMAKDLENQIANLDKGYQTITNEISKLEEEWHKEINIVITKMKTEIDDIKVKHGDILQQHLDEIKQVQSLIHQTMQSLKEVEESNEVSMIIEYSSKIRDFNKLPPKVEISLPSFTQSFNQDGELRWRHTGHPSTTKYESFIPWGITTDSQSRVLAADGDNHCIIVLDQNGQFLCYIDNCDLNFPWGLCVDNDDNLFVCESVRGNVKKIKYLK